MKKRVLLLLILSLTIYFAGISIAHSPGSIEIEYDFDTNLLTVTVYHDVTEPDTHYINQIDVWVNDILNTTEYYTRQFETTYQLDTFNITANHGDTIKIKAHCNVSGSLIDEFILQDPVIHEFGIVLPLILFTLISAFLGLKVYRKKK
jgi:hypothetical protein